MNVRYSPLSSPSLWVVSSPACTAVLGSILRQCPLHSSRVFFLCTSLLALRPVNLQPHLVNAGCLPASPWGRWKLLTAIHGGIRRGHLNCRLSLRDHYAVRLNAPCREYNSFLCFVVVVVVIDGFKWEDK